MRTSILPKNHGKCFNFDFLGHFVIFRAQNEVTRPLKQTTKWKSSTMTMATFDKFGSIIWQKKSREKIGKKNSRSFDFQEVLELYMLDSKIFLIIKKDKNDHNLRRAWVKVRPHNVKLVQMVRT